MCTDKGMVQLSQVLPSTAAALPAWGPGWLCPGRRDLKIRLFGGSSLAPGSLTLGPELSGWGVVQGWAQRIFALETVNVWWPGYCKGTRQALLGGNRLKGRGREDNGLPYLTARCPGASRPGLFLPRYLFPALATHFKLFALVHRGFPRTKISQA